MTFFDEFDDRQLLERTQAGEATAFGVFYRRHRSLVLGFLRRRTSNPETAADLMSEVFATALLAVHRGQASAVETPTAWLLTLARNKFTDSIRRGRVEAAARRKLGISRSTIDDEDIARIEELASSDGDLLARARALPAAQWEAVSAHVLDEQDYGDVARSLKCSELVVRKRVSRALKALRDQLTQEVP